MRDITEVAASSGFSSLLHLLLQVGLKDTLMKKGSEYTLFAPTNAAFEALNPASVRHMLLSDERLKKILLYHIVSGKILSQDISHGLTVPTILPGTFLQFGITFSGIKVNNASIVDGNIPTANGVIHVISDVLLPPEELIAVEITKNSTENIVDVVTKVGLSHFVKHMEEMGLDHFMKEQGTFTVFAPSNSAFEEISPHSMIFLSKNDDTFRAVLLYHVLRGEIPYVDLVNDMQMTSLQGQKIRFNNFLKKDKSISTINGANIIDRDILATNGIVHVIDKMLIPPSGNIIEVLRENPRFSTLLEAIEVAGLTEFLKSESSFTVFAPVNEAFDVLAPALLQDTTTKRGIMSEIILRHVVLGHHHGPLFSAALCWDTVISANNVLIHTGMGTGRIMKVGTQFGNASIIEPDIMALNGVVHSLNGMI